MYIGRRIYYELSTGNIVFDTGEKSGDVVETTIEQDFETYVALQERVRSTIGVIQLEYGQYAEDFMQCNGYSVDVSGEEPVLLFSYPDPEDPADPPIYRLPLSVQVADQEQRLADIELALADIFTGGGD